MNASPRKSVLFNAYSDLPTATLQRIKALTTSSLPTFFDIGTNFGGSSIAEDSMRKLGATNKSTAKVRIYARRHFNVEDLHAVDEGVIRHLFPLLEDKSKLFDLPVGHFLGVDYVGHRRVVDTPDKLLIVLGDHDMDRLRDVLFVFLSQRFKVWTTVAYIVEANATAAMM
ncbi:hypothetical protein C8J57DRAFT_1713596 [Mycena rebaudengoi]|nr:hypothetical protein C8J57DRAFT_1713596 [Mycena rebaudengoi]